MELLTTGEAADYLRLGERKLYELVAAGAIPCSKVTGKWLFPRHELDRWVISGLARPAGMVPGEAPPIVGGSQDDLLEWSLRQSGSGLASLTEGTEAGVARLLRGEIAAAAIHFHGAADEDNVAFVERMPQLHDALLVGMARREQGLLLPPGNSKGFASLEDVIEGKARLAVRQKGAGAQMLLDAMLARLGVSVESLNRLEPACLSGPDLAAAIREGRADCGVATRSAARAAGLDFVTLTWESFDLLMRQRTYFTPPLQALVEFLASEGVRRRAADLTGYDLTPAGTIRYFA
ncbi:MAG: helix-turn-helix transcriptional regulator [Aurantimonas endophytica]|uniref:Excisionase family DNA binding protein n=1 Tax=Aurantimonas endophytica TaxID=1522175 RepID=A0A7W6HB71_9HYPH|nr:helix-turn-helix transcriptional regulator [Aurantimonas endophytica]MBB4001989.1 excisionase family DNA binding protein [Aurantimonas endophytica]MCO6402378.1 helix-turn-helix domain-containing protein [Aurantimonas endophytica]